MRCYFLILAAALVTEISTVAAATLPVAPNSIKPVYLDYSTHGARAFSPDGKFEITVTGENTSLGAWVTINEPAQGWSIQVWPIERNVEVLWKPDSQFFALTDNRYANQSYVLIVGTEFRMDGPALGLQRLDVTPILRQALASSARQYYRTTDYDGSWAFYAKALRWTSNEDLLVGVSAITSLPQHALGAAHGVKGWILAYLLDVPQKKVIETLSQEAVREKYGIDLSKMALRN